MLRTGCVKMLRNALYAADDATLLTEVLTKMLPLIPWCVW